MIVKDNNNSNNVKYHFIKNNLKMNLLFIHLLLKKLSRKIVIINEKRILIIKIVNCSLLFY